MTKVHPAFYLKKCNQNLKQLILLGTTLGTEREIKKILLLSIKKSIVYLFLHVVMSNLSCEFGRLELRSNP